MVVLMVVIIKFNFFEFRSSDELVLAQQHLVRHHRMHIRHHRGRCSGGLLLPPQPKTVSIDL